VGQSENETWLLYTWQQKRILFLKRYVLKTFFYVHLPELHSLLIYGTLHYSEDNYYILWKIQFEMSLKIYWLYHTLLSPLSGVCVQQ